MLIVHPSLIQSHCALFQVKYLSYESVSINKFVPGEIVSNTVQAHFSFRNPLYNFYHDFVQAITQNVSFEASTNYKRLIINLHTQSVHVGEGQGLN